jgi:hypothetical protein
LEFEGVIQITPQMRILVAVEAVDLRRGIDGLAQICKDALHSDPFSGGLIVFGTGRRQRSKCSFMTVKVFGCARNGCRRADSAGGRRIRGK